MAMIHDPHRHYRSETAWRAQQEDLDRADAIREKKHADEDKVMNESMEVVQISGGASLEQQRLMPVLTMGMAVQRREFIVEVVKKLMGEGVDYGTIPGTPKPTLLQPGADKLCNLFGLAIKYEFVEVVKDWTGAEHGGEPFFYYEVKGRAYRGDSLMGEGVGSCNSWESRYRWRKAERVCPNCQTPAIVKGKPEYGGGWICYAKKGGCGAKFAAGDPIIESQEVGRVPNPDVYDLVNTVLKIALKRCKVSATINATSASEFFTQDIEDIDTGGQPVGTWAASDAVAGRKIAEAEQKIAHQKPEEIPVPVLEIWGRMKGVNACITELGKLKRQLKDAIGDAGELEYYRALESFGAKHANEMKSGEESRKCALKLWKIIQMAESLNVSEEDAKE